MSSQLYSILGWFFLPNLATRHSLKLLYKSGFLAPPTNQPTQSLHHRLAYSTVVGAYLIFTLVWSAAHIDNNFYEILGVGRDTDDDGLKAAFRQFARRNHPDKVGPQGMELFLAVRNSFEALKSPLTRWAYDRFGEDAMRWEGLSTRSEYLHRGLMQSSGFHIVSFLILLVMSAVGGRNPVSFWRYIMFFSALILELAFVISPAAVPELVAFAKLFPSRVTFQHIRLLHNIFFSASIGISRIGPALFPTDEKDDVLMQAQAASVMVSALMQSDLRPAELPSPPGGEASISSNTIQELSNELENMVIERLLVTRGGPLASAVQKAIADGRAMAQTAVETVVSAATSRASSEEPSEREQSPEVVEVEGPSLPTPSMSIRGFSHPPPEVANVEVEEVGEVGFMVTPNAVRTLGGMSPRPSPLADRSRSSSPSGSVDASYAD
ncbi:hypothetical protein CYLTODRAFT_492196 [Cylindrobasidium torrendii FP15055 ss-10]|uniref:J domain-containing protein n=1 Tax=Cylindrobasidium torrendii FP15055 ss-10 TaxID=1314674 RepID=A0A0D7B4U0_9AGAR|nr:hypothetical protein CYLTODRAFT_492196 [Cylindrobasidium torrendii FP15055 ss-10]